MKNLKKLVIASFMLVIAFVAVVSSTYAWFTASSSAKVNDISIEVVDADYSILISKNGYETVPTWGSSVSFAFNGKVKPVTLVDGQTREFKSLAIAEGDTLRVNYENAEILPGSNVVTTTATEGYIVFDLWFQVDAANDETLNGKKIVLDVTGLKAYMWDKTLNEGQGDWSTTSNDLAVSSFRLAAASVSGVPAQGENESTEAVGAILDHPVQGTRAATSPDVVGTYGVGQQFVLSNSWMDIYKASSLTQYNDETNPQNYKLVAEDTTSKGAVNIDETVATADGTHGEVEIPLVTVLNGSTTVTNQTRGYAHIRVYVWMEGWDGDCINAAAGCKYVFVLKFQLI